MLSPTCTDAIPRSTAAIPPQYWIASTVLMLPPTCTAATLRSTEQPPQYWCYSSAVLMLSPTVLNSLHSTDAIPHMYWWYPPTVLNSLRSTEPTLYWVKISNKSNKRLLRYCIFSSSWRMRLWRHIYVKMRLKTHKMATSILLKFVTLGWDISRTIWRIEVSDGSFFFYFSRSFIWVQFLSTGVSFKVWFNESILQYQRPSRPLAKCKRLKKSFTCLSYPLDYRVFLLFDGGKYMVIKSAPYLFYVSNKRSLLPRFGPQGSTHGLPDASLRQWTITLKMADQGRSDSYVVFTMILCDANFFVWWDMKLKFHSHLQITPVSLCNWFETCAASNDKVIDVFCSWSTQWILVKTI